MHVLERDIEGDTCRRAENEMGVTNTKLVTPGQTGWPDRIFWLPKRPFLIEFKKPGESPKKKQSYIHDMLVKLGYEVEVHDDTDKALAAIRAALKRRGIKCK